MSLYYFTYRTRDIPHLQPFNGADLQDGETAFLQRCAYARLPGGTDALNYYRSEVMNDMYLVICHVDTHTFLFYISDRFAFIAWKKEYEHQLEMFTDLFVPKAGPPPDIKVTHLDKAAYKRVFGPVPVVREGWAP